ncbi:hypothetical protein CEB3_c19490 [Peptococcaceae bacterium CEB3]|nr:hypothetical protein CEB3_c19490 [Peptococcaceae bacterium CEB3]
MSYSLKDNFSLEFWGNLYNPEITDMPQTVVDAVASMKQFNPERWENMARDIFGTSPERLTVEMVLEKIEETNTASSIGAPVGIWIDPDGFFTVDIWDI